MRFFEEIIEDKSFAVLEEADIAVDRAFLAYETARKDQELKLRELECKCVLESGDFEALCQYYEAGEEGDKSKGLLKNVWEAILKAFRALKTKLFGEKKPDPTQMPKKTKVPKVIATAIKGLKGAWANAKSAFANIKQNITNHKGLATLLALLVVGGGVAAGAVAHNKNKNNESANDTETVEINTSDLVDAYETTKDMVATGEKVASEYVNDPNANPDNVNIIKKFQKRVSSFSTTLHSLIPFGNKNEETVATNEQTTTETPDDKTEEKDTTTTDSKSVSLGGNVNGSKIRNTVEKILKEAGVSGGERTEIRKKINAATEEKKLSVANQLLSKYNITITESAELEEFLNCELYEESGIDSLFDGMDGLFI